MATIKAECIFHCNEMERYLEGIWNSTILDLIPVMDTSFFYVTWKSYIAGTQEKKIVYY